MQTFNAMIKALLGMRKYHQSVSLSTVSISNSKFAANTWDTATHAKDTGYVHDPSFDQAHPGLFALASIWKTELVGRKIFIHSLHLSLSLSPFLS